MWRRDKPSKLAVLDQWGHEMMFYTTTSEDGWNHSLTAVLVPVAFIQAAGGLFQSFPVPESLAFQVNGLDATTTPEPGTLTFFSSAGILLAGLMAFRRFRA